MPEVAVLGLARHVQHLEIDSIARELLLLVADGGGDVDIEGVGVDDAGEHGGLSAVVKPDE